jgi:hypothetical protein
VTCWISLDLSNFGSRSEIFAKCLAHDETFKRSVPLVPKVHAHLSCS